MTTWVVLFDIIYRAMDTNTQMSEGIERLFIIRNGHAVIATHADGPWGSVEPLSQSGEQHAVAAGLMVRQLLEGDKPAEALSAPSRRSKLTLLKALGAAGWSTSISELPALAHTGKALHVVKRDVREVLMRHGGPVGPRVLAMSRRAILAGLSHEFRDYGITDDDIDAKPEKYEDDFVPPGSVIVVQRDGDALAIEAIFAGSRTPEEIARDDDASRQLISA